MARDKNIARKSALINSDSEDRLNVGDAQSVAHLARLSAPVGPGPNALPTTLSAGTIAFTAFQSDNTGGAGGDYFQFVLLTGVTTGTTIYFTDCGSRTDNFRFRTNENLLRWVAQSDLPAGTLISFTATGGAGVVNTAEWTGINPVTGGVASNAQLPLNTGGDNITAFVSPVFAGSDNLGGTAIAALAFGQATFSATYNTSSPTSQTGLPGGLTDGVNAVSIAPTNNGRYTGTTSGTASALRSAMNTDTNWTTGVSPLSPHGVAAITVLNPGMLSVNDVTLAEGDSGATSFVFTITRTGGSDGAVGATWTLTTIFGGGVDAADFVTYPQSGTVSFANGETSQQITIQVQGDTTVEPDEAFTVTLSAPTGGVTTSNIGVGRILNDDLATISIDDISHSEGDSGSTVYTFTVTRSGGSSGAVGATWTISFPGGPGGANSGDLAAGQSLTGTVSFANGETSKTITVNVNGDYLPEDTETFNVVLSAPTGGVTISDSTGVGTITNDDFPGAISIDDVSHSEGDGGTTLYTFTVSRTGQAANTSVQWALGAPGGGGNAGATDFPTSQALSGTITFAGGETSRTITVSVLGDHLYELDESFTVTLSNPSAGATIADGTGIGTILTDDAAPPFTPDGNETTVNQNIDQDQVGPRVAWIDAGHYVVTWTSHETPTSYEVMARLFNADGTPAGDEFQVNTTSVGDQVGNRVAALSGGGFVIVWSDQTTTDIRAQMFNADGTPDGIELLLNIDPNAQSVPWVSALPGGGFAAVWMHNDGVSYDIRGRTFGADGLPVSAEFAVNTNTALNQQYAQMTTLANGHFVVVWHDASGVGGDASSTAIKMRVFDTDGTALTAETLVNTTIAGMQQFPAVGALAGGGYVVAWEDYSASGGDISGNALRAQIYDASGNAVGSEFIVNFTTEGDQSRPTITGLPDGGFVIGWWNQANGVSVNEVRALAFDALGNRRGGEFEVNSDSAGDQLGPAFAASPVNGHLVATWNDFNDSQDLTDGEIEQRLFTMPAPGALSIADLAQAEGNAGPNSFTFTVTRTGGSLGTVGATWTLTLSGDADAADFTAVPQTGTISFADGETSKTITIFVQGDTLFEPNEIFAVLLSSPTGGASIADGTGQGTITNDDPMPALAVDLDGGDPGNDFASGYTEQGAGAPIGNAIAVTQGTLPITRATITVTDAVAGDQLAASGTLPATIAVDPSSTATNLILIGAGSTTDWAAALALVRYTHAGDNPDVFGTDAERAISVVVSDGVASSAAAVATVTIAAVNDAPTVGALDGDSVTWTEGDPYVLLDQNMPATVFDPDNQNFAGGFVSVGVQANPRAEDEFFVLDIFPGVGTIGNDVYVDGAHIGTITSSGPGQILTISFNIEATAERVATLLDYIAYRNVAGDDPTAGGRSVTYLLNDGHGGASAGVVTVDVAAVNDAPVVTTTAGTTAYAESVDAAPGSVAVNNALTVADGDDVALTGGTVSITGNFQAGQDILAFTNDNAAAFGNIGAVYNAGSGVLTLASAGGTETVAQWQAALRAVTYSNSSEEPSQATRTISFTVNDGDAASIAATRLLSVTAQNDSPSGTDATVTINEDSIFTFTAAHFGFSDVDGDAFAGVRFGAAPAGGTLYFDADGAGGNAPVAVATFPTATYSAADIAAGKLTFVPTLNLNGTGAASVGFTVVDDGGTVGAGRNADTTPNTLSFDIVSVNDAPSGADQTIAVTEDTAYTLKVADFGFSDVDGNAFEAVIFSNVAGGTLYINGNPMTNVTLVYLITIQSGGVVFVPAANATGAAGSLTFTVRDDGGFANGGQAADPTPNTLTFNMSAVNDAPVNTVPGAQTINEDAARLFSSANGNALSVTDVDATTLTVTLAVGHGTLTLASTLGLGFADGDGNADATMTFSGTVAAINAALGAGLTYTPAANYNGGDTLSMSTSDNGQSGAGGMLTDSDSVAITINPVNDAPDGIGKTITLNEDTPKTLSAADFAFTDVEGNGLLSVTIVTLPGAGILYYDADGPGGAGLPVAVVAGTTFTAAQLGGARLSYVPGPNGNGAGYANFTYTVRDNGGTANGGQDTDASPATIVFNVTPVNDAPASTGLDGDAAAYDEDMPAGTVWLDVGRDAIVTDIDSADFAGGSLTVAIIVNKAAGEDQLVLDTASNGVTMVGSEIFVDAISVGTISADGVGLDRIITFNSGATAALVSRLIQNFSYFNTNQATPSTAQRLVEFRLADGDGGTIFAHTTVAVTAVDDPPVIANFNSDDVTFVEGSAAIRVDMGGDALVTDVDSMDFDGGYLQVLLEDGVASEDVVGFATGAETGITLSDGTNTGSIVSIDGIAIGTIVSGSPAPASFTVNFNANADAADVTALLRAITYLNTNTDNPATQSRAVAVFVSDGDGAGQTGAVSNVHVTRVNDAPVNTVPGAQIVAEDGGLTLSTANGNPLSVADVDATTLTVTLSVAHGTLTIASMLGLTFSGGSDGTADASMTFSGTAAAINAALGAGLTYNPDANFNGSDAISVVTTDNGQTGTGPAGTDSDAVAISITAINDAPAGADAAFTINEDSTFTFAEGHFGFTDPVEGDDFLGVVIATVPSAGTLFYDGVAVIAGQFVSLHDIALGKLTFVPAANGNGVPFSSFTFQVRDNGGTLNGGQDTDQSPNIVTFNVTAVNDAPTNNVPGGQTINEDSSFTLSTGNGNAISVADVDATTLTVTLSVAHGTLTIASTAGLSFSGGSDGTADASMTFSGTAAAINAALGAGLTYNPNGDFNGSDAISVVTTDGGQTGTGPVGTDSDSVPISITAINDAPSGTNGTITLNEDATRTLAQADFGFSDPVEGHGFAGVVITTLPTHGTLLLNGAALLVAETFVSAAQLAAGQLVFQPDGNANGAAYATLTFQVRDDGGTANGGQDTDQSANTLTFAVTAINDSPVVDLNGAGVGTSATLNYSENGAATAIAPGGAIIDIDTTDFGGGTLGVTMTNGLNAEDMLSILNQGTGAGQVGYANGLITYEGVTIADLLPTLGAPVPILDIRFRSNVAVSQAAVQAVLQAVAYHNLSQDPSTTPRNVTFSFNDGDGNPAGGDPPGNAAATINVASVNDAPSGAGATITIDEDGSRVLTQADFGFSDPAEGDNFAGVLLTSLPANGTLLLNGVAVTVAGIFVSAAQIAASQLVFAPGLNGNGAGYASFNFAVRDDGGTGNGGQDTDQSPNTLTFDVTAVNDAPAGANATIVINEDNGRVLTAADFGFSDTADGNAFAGVVLTSLPTAGFLIYDPDGAGGLPGVLANVGRFITAAELAMGALTYYPASHANGAGSASFTFQVRDNGGTGNGGQDTDQSPNTITFDINPVNDAPSGADKTITGSEDDPYVFAAADFGFTDPVEGNAFVAVRITTLPTAGDILLNGVAVMAGDFIAVSAINAGMLTFQPGPDAFGAPYAGFTFQVQDSGGTANGGVDVDQTPNTITINITPDNLAPVLDLDAGTAGVNATFSYTENGPAAPISPNATLTDDSPDFAGGTIIAHFTANGAAEDQLSIRSGGGVAVSPTDDTLTYGGVLIGSWGGGVNGADLVVQLNANASAAAVEAVLRAISYANLSDAPSVLARTIDVAVTDGDGGAASALVTVNLTAVDDAAVARNDAFTISEAAQLSGNVFLDHGAGADGDVDGPGLAVSAVNGSSVHVGQQIQLDSGALLTLNSDGSFTYATNHAFDPTPTGSSGASNTPAVDHFSYTLAGGGTATVTFAITGLDTDDTLFGTAGADVLAGGNGNDSYRVENEADLVLESVGGGQDGIYVAMNLGAYALAAGSEVEILSAIDPASAAAMNLTGNEYANILIGTAGSNTLIGGGGADILVGGAGNDFYRVEEAGDAVVEGAGGGFDSVYAVGSYTLAAGAEIELLSAIDPASTAAMNLTGNEFANLIYGNAAGNTLIGGAGNDTLLGGAGNDFYRVETAGDVVVEYAGGGFDSVYAVESYTLAAGSEIELLSAIDPASTAAMNLTGNEFANLIYGNAGVNTLIGGGGADTLIGGAGNDFYRVEEAGDVVVEAAGGGTDAVYAVTSYALNAGAEVELLSAIDPGSTGAMDLTGNDYGNTIIGTAGANTLIGGGGNDVLAGGLGNDVYRVEDAGDVVQEYAGGGADAVYAVGSYTLQDGYEIEVLSAIDPNSTAGINLTGNNLSNTLFGNAGANILDGKSGADALVGGGGADIFAFTTALGGGNVDTITDFAPGTDKIGLDDAIFTAIGGTLSASAFVIGSAAADADDRIIYNSATGQLFYDADGNGLGAAVQFATLLGAPTLTAGDFTMI